MRFHSLLPAFSPNDATGTLASELQMLLRRLGFLALVRGRQFVVSVQFLVDVGFSVTSCHLFHSDSLRALSNSRAM